MDFAELLAALERRERVAEVRPQAPPREPIGRGQGPRTITLMDRQPFTKGPFFAWLAPWGAGSLVEGKDYVESLTLDPDTFPANSMIRWAWPAKPAVQPGVYNFLAINFGDTYGTAVQSPIPPRRVADIVTLTQTHDLTISGAPDGFDVIIDYFLTKEANKHDVHLFEIEVFLHTPNFSKDYVRSVRQLGVFNDPQGRRWTVAINAENAHGPAILFMPANQQDLLQGSVDLRAMHVWLIERGVITGREWFNGHGLGVEVRQGSGSMTVNRLTVDYR